MSPNLKRSLREKMKKAAELGLRRLGICLSALTPSYHYRRRLLEQERVLGQDSGMGSVLEWVLAQ